MDKNYQWDLSDMYSSDKDWETSCNEILIKLNDFSKYKGKLSTNGEIFLEVIKEAYSLREK